MYFRFKVCSNLKIKFKFIETMSQYFPVKPETTDMCGKDSMVTFIKGFNMICEKILQRI